MVGLLLLTTIPAVARAQTATLGRFKDPEGITADPTGLRRDTAVRAYPRFPWGFEKTRITGTAVVAFVIDTTGQVEMETATFLSLPRSEFVKSVCDALPKMRFQPFVVADQKWRVLLVEMYAFHPWSVPDTAAIRAASRLAARRQEEFATKPIKDVVQEIAPLPTCNLPRAQ